MVKSALKEGDYLDSQTTEQLESIKQKILSKIMPEAIYLFGSYAYGTPSPDSDLDLYIVIPDSSVRPLEAAQIINNAIYDDLRKPVDILVGKVSDFNRRKNLPTLERMVAAKGMLLYCAAKISV